jgi:hypothetical protein
MTNPAAKITKDAAAKASFSESPSFMFRTALLGMLIAQAASFILLILFKDTLGFLWLVAYLSLFLFIALAFITPPLSILLLVRLAGRKVPFDGITKAALLLAAVDAIAAIAFFLNRVQA